MTINLKNIKPIATSKNLSYVPMDNIVDTFLTDQLPDVSLCATAFYIIFHNNNLILANNVRRGMEICGGHVDPGETIHQAALRETSEEIGYFDIKYLGHFVRRHVSTAIVEEDYKYPHPVSYMTFFVGEAKNFDYDLIIEDECNKPFIIPLGPYGYSIPETYLEEWNKFMEKHAIKEMLKYSYDMYCASKK